MTDSRSTGGRAAEVAREIEAEIIRLRWPVGRVLGSEEELRERYGVSRAVLREALILIEHHGVGHMRRGRAGGLVVTVPDSLPAIRALVLHLEAIEVQVADLMQARLLLEPIAARRAASRIDGEGRARLEEVVQAEESQNSEPGISTQHQLHVLLAELSGNPALHLFVDVLARLTARYASTTRSITSAQVKEGKAQSRRAHAAISAAVRGRHIERAEDLVRRHLQGVESWLAAESPGRAARRPPAHSHLADGPEPKMADVVAARIHDEIARRGWPVGIVLGSESDLIARHGVGRETLREAVGLLEYHSIARMRKGPGGGLVVTPPDPRASIESVALVLEHRAVTPEHLHELREALEIGALDRVVRNRRETAAEVRLGRELTSAQDSTTPLQVRGDSFHVAVAELSGNPILVLFLQILSELWARHAVVPGTPDPGPDAEAQVERAHRRILEAIVAKDLPTAERRMRRHLSALTQWYH